MQNLVSKDYAKHIHAHTTAKHRHPSSVIHINILTIQNLIYTQLKTDSKQRSETDKDSSMERTTWQNAKRSLHRKPSLEKTILRLFLPGTEPETFQSQVAIPRIAEDAVTVSEMETLLNVK